MKFYIAYSAAYGPHEGAILVAAHNVKEAKRLSWRRIPWSIIAEDYTDLRVKWIKDDTNVRPLANQDKLANDIPHVIDNPVVCIACNHWGDGLDVNGNCSWCGNWPGEDLVNLLKGVRNDK